MRTNQIFVMSLIACSALTVCWVLAEQPLTGQWDGEITANGSDQHIRALFKYVQNPYSSSPEPTLAAIVDIPQIGIRAADAKKVRLKYPTVYFELPAGAGDLIVFEGKLSSQHPSVRSDQLQPADQISGTCTIGDTRKTFILRRRKGQ